MSDISLHFEWYELLAGSYVIGWPGALIGAALGALLGAPVWFFSLLFFK